MDDTTAEQRQKLRKSMMGLLARREHSKLELAQKMQLRGYNEALIDDNIEDFVAKGWQSDSRYTEMLIRSRAMKLQGPLKIKMELKQKGIDSVMIHDFMDQDYDWFEVAAEAIKKKFSAVAVEQKDKIKQQRFLQQRGFSHEQIRYAVSSLGKALSDLT